IAGAVDPNDPNNSVAAVTANQPERILSRLVCPRQLAANTSYLACVVPTYGVGVAAGLGLDVAADAPLGDAWPLAPDSVTLPVYYHWEFSTGGPGNFKSLVTRLQAHAPGTNVGTRALDITTPGFGVEDLAVATEVPLGGALRVSE